MLLVATVLRQTQQLAPRGSLVLSAPVGRRAGARYEFDATYTAHIDCGAARKAPSVLPLAPVLPRLAGCELGLQAQLMPHHITHALDHNNLL